MTYFSCSTYGQGSGIYMLTEKYVNINNGGSFSPSWDSVYVTNPTGAVVAYSIANNSFDVRGHNSQFNVIINGIISNGYRIIEMSEWTSSYFIYSGGVNEYVYVRTIFLGAP